jgi:cysteine sulfinate desulfinase/cysteine desulfurase-like protein/MFS family permease
VSTTTAPVRLGLRANLPQFALLVAINALVGGMVGQERAVLPLMAEQIFGLTAFTAAMTFIVAFGLVKAVTNFLAGALSDRYGRKPVLVAGWLIGVPVPLLLIWAPSWGWVIAANVLLGINHGLTWSTTVIMKIDLVGPSRRGLAMGLNEAAGYGAVALTAMATGYLAETYGLRPEPFYLGIAFAALGLGLSTLAVKETHAHARHEARSYVVRSDQLHHELGTREVFAQTTIREPALSAASQAGLVNNLNDGLAWGLFPIVFAAAGLRLGQIGLLAGIYPAVWGAGQLVTGALSDRIGRKWLIAGGMGVQALGIALVAIGDTFAVWAIAAMLMGMGTAMVYPTLLAVIGDVAHPTWRARSVGVYRFWRDSGYAVGALLAGVLADAFGYDTAIWAVAALTAASGAVVAVRMYETRPQPAGPSTNRRLATGDTTMNAKFPTGGQRSMHSHPGLDDGPIYLDYNATTPVDPRVVAAMQPFLEAWFGNPSSAHRYATAATRALRTAREQVAALIGGDPAGIVFTGSGSEADNLAIRGTVLASPTGRQHVITQATEHPAVLATCHALQRLHGTDVTILPVDSHGQVDPQDLAEAITPDTTLVSVMLANNETGSIQPVAELAQVARAHGVPIHTDAAQAVGKIPVNVNDLGVGMLTIAGHKMYAPKGIAVLYVRPSLNLEPVIYGGGQERGLRSGTENVAYAVALGAAADLARADLDAGSTQRLTDLRDRLHDAIADALPGAVHLNGHPDSRLPNTVNLSITGVPGDALLADVPEIAASTGSACHTGATDPSPVLSAMGLNRDRALGALRLSLGRWTTRTDVDQAAAALINAASSWSNPAPTPLAAHARE